MITVLLLIFKLDCLRLLGSVTCSPGLLLTHNVLVLKLHLHLVKSGLLPLLVIHLLRGLIKGRLEQLLVLMNHVRLGIVRR